MAYFTNYDIIICILSLITYIADVITDVILIAVFFLEGHAIWGSMSLCFVAVATLFMQIFSFHWHASDKSLTWKEFFIHILFLAPVHRYFMVLRLGLKSRKSRCPEDLDAAYRGLNDICILRLFETFLEAAPQLVLQLYIITSDVRNADPLVGVSSVFSLLSVAWAVTAYTDALHVAYKKLYKRSAMSLITHSLWQTGMITSRVFAVVLFATVFKSLVAVPIALHTVSMVLWIAILKPDFGTTACEKGLFTIVAAVIHTFCFLNLKDGKSRWRMLFYYTVVFVENTVLISLWFSFNDTNQPSWLSPVGFTAVFGGFLIGVISLFLYYCCCHPSGPAPVTENQKPTFKRSGSLKQKDETANNKQPVFNVTSSSAAMINLWLSASLDLTKEGLVQNPDNYLDTNLTTSEEGQGDRRTYGNTGNNRMDEFVEIPGSNLDTDTFVEGKMNSGRGRNESKVLDKTLNSTNLGNLSFPNNDHEQYSLPSYNIIEMFARCKQDPIFSSTLSMNRSLGNTAMYDSNYHSASYGDRSLSLSRDQDQSLQYKKAVPRHSVGRPGIPVYESNTNTTPEVLNSMEYSPIQISPLDPYKLLEESNSRHSNKLNERAYLYSTGSENAINSTSAMESTPILSVQPDVSRGITRLSLSYSELDTVDGDLCQQNHRQCYEYSSEASSLQLSRYKDISPPYAKGALRKSDDVTFSNMSLPLPDDSMQTKYGRSKQTSAQDLSPEEIKNNCGRTGYRPPSKTISPLSNVLKNRSMDSFYTNSPTDRQMSCMSDQGLSSSDHVHSLSDSATSRSHRSLTSSGFQSEESNFSSPGNMHGHVGVHGQFQSTPILENEISSIQDVPSCMRVQKRESMDVDLSKASPQAANTIVSVYDHSASAKDKRKPFPSALMYSESLEQVDSPSLPPLTVSSRRSSSAGSGNSGRFFRDLTEDCDNTGQSEVSDSSGTFSQSVDSSRRTRYSTYNEKSSLSAFLSEKSSSITGNVQSSDDSISLSSDPERMADKMSIPSISVKKDRQSPVRRKSDPVNRIYENIDDFISNDQREIPIESNATSQINPNKDNMDQIPSSKLDKNSFQKHFRHPAHVNNDDCIVDGSDVERLDDCENRSGRNDDIFNRERWRASLDKEMRARLVQDIEKLAPRKLYQLRAKTDTDAKKKISPIKISDYNDSPYKFRRSAGRQSDYVNITNVSPDSLGSSYEHVHILTPGVYTDYENVFNLNRLKTGNCPLVRPESLSDSLILDEQVASHGNCHSVGTIMSEPCSAYISTVSRPYPIETREMRSPINTTGVNSAFKPVKPRRSFENDNSSSNSSAGSDNPIFEEGLSQNSRSNISIQDELSLHKNKPGLESTSATFTVNRSQVIPNADSSVESAPWSTLSDSRAQSFDFMGQTPVNYLKLAGTAPLSFSMYTLPPDDRSSRCSSHSYSNSIPWEDPENHSSNQSTQDRSGSGRKPLGSLENTPVFSPIYGQDVISDTEKTNRKRFMSTPKLSLGCDSRVSKTPNRSFYTPQRRYSSGFKNKTFSDDTSTWSSQSVSGQEWALETNERSSLSKTTYI